jgi:hypothetical protein
MWTRAILSALLVFVAAPAQTHQHGIWEIRLTAGREYPNPLTEPETTVEFSVPGGARETVRPFWDGGRDWLVRYSPERAGRYTYRVKSNDSALNGKSGTVRVNAFRGSNPLYRAGGPRLSPNRRYFVHADGRPWFWLADTAWNGALLSTAGEWSDYISDRVAKRFTAVQVVMTQWRAGRADENRQVAFTGKDSIAVNPAFFRRMDEKIRALNDAGLVAVPVILWALSSKEMESPGVGLPTREAKLLARYIADRYGAHKVVWFLGGDGSYAGAENFAKWSEIGRFVFPEWLKRAPAGMHPRGMQEPWGAYKDEPWLDVLFYQSGHGGDPKKWRWNATRGPAADWKMEPVRPVIDAEPNYEAHISYNGQKIDDAAVRRAAYYSLLGAPPAGISYGAHGIWPWIRKPEVPLDHPRSGVAEPWRECLNYPGARQMTVLRNFFESLEWWRLRPDRCLLGEETADDSFRSYVMSAVAEGGDFGLLYLPVATELDVNAAALGNSVRATWVDPRTGKRDSAGTLAGKPAKVKPPAEGDWLLLLERADRTRR